MTFQCTRYAFDPWLGTKDPTGLGQKVKTENRSNIVTNSIKTLKMVYIKNGEGNGNPLQYSCLEHPMDRGAWWATVHGVTKSQK